VVQKDASIFDKVAFCIERNTLQKPVLQKCKFCVVYGISFFFVNHHFVNTAQ